MQTINLPLNTPVTITIKAADSDGKFEALPGEITFTLTNSNTSVLEADLTVDHVGAPAVRMKAIGKGTDIKLTIENDADLPPAELLINVVAPKSAKSLTLDVANMAVGVEEIPTPAAQSKPAPTPAPTPAPIPAPKPAPAHGSRK